VSAPPRLEYPTDYPIKVVGRATAALRAEIDAIMVKHAADFDASGTHERLSANGRFLALSYRIRAVSAEQVEALAAELRAAQSVLLVF
jgi:putative lipoic acid-binding regulatory protein